MTGLTDVRDRTLTMLRALGIEPDRKQMRTVEKYVRWVDGQISTAHIDGRVMDREVACGHEMTVTHDPHLGGADYTVTCHEPPGADCRLACADDDCEQWAAILRDVTGPYHVVNDDPADEPVQHRMTDNGQCNAADWRQPRIRGRPLPDPRLVDRRRLRMGEGMTMTVTASYSEPRETMRTMSGDVTTLTGVDVTVEYAYGDTTAALAALDRAAEHVRAQILATTTPVIVARPDKQDERIKP